MIPGEIDVEDYYVAFLDMVKHVLDGSMEPNAFEETLREMFSTRAFHAFTIDKIIANAVRQVRWFSFFIVAYFAKTVVEATKQMFIQ